VSSLLFFDHYDDGAEPSRFMLGADAPNWLSRFDVSLLLSFAALRKHESKSKKFPRALAPWGSDSSAYHFQTKYGRHIVPAAEYAASVRRWKREAGNHLFAVPQDWLCSRDVRALTGLTVEESQARTVDSYFELNTLAEEVNFIPVLQGDTFEDYLRHVEEYDRRGVNLWNLDLIGVGSVAHRSDTPFAVELINRLHGDGLTRLHVFGMKADGIEQVAPLVASLDSHAWSYRARKNPPLEGCRHRRCEHCPKFALQWRERVVRAIENPSGQTRLFL
jgi:hypothetical protein